VITAYLTAAESDVYLAAYADWLALDEAVKNNHLSWGRVYIDSIYLCPYDETDATDDLKHANSLAGYMNFNDTLYANVSEVESTTVTAGSVSSSKTYRSGAEATNEDPMIQKVTALLTDCSSSTSTATVGLSRN